MLVLTNDPGEGCIDEVWVLVDARLVSRVALISEKLKVVVVILFASIVQLLEIVHVQVEIVAGLVQIAASG